ncbi:hypothetical protein [Labrys neptuniae]
MKVIIVKSGAGDCGDHCAAWISAEGEIEKSTPALFRRALTAMGKHKLPVLISSPGGDVRAAMAIGRLIHAKGLDVVVSRTVLLACQDSSRACSDSKLLGRTGKPVSFTSYCASACTNILAAGVHRIVSPRYALIGVHAMTVTINRRRIEKTPIFTRSGQYRGYQITVTTDEGWPEQAKPAQYKFLSSYLKEMGIKGDLIGLMHLAMPDEAHWMTSAELSDTGLATERRTGEDYIAAIEHPPVAPPTTEPGLGISRQKYTPPTGVVCASPPKSLPSSAEETQARVELPISMTDTLWMLSKEAANIGYPLNQQYLGYGVTVVTTLTGTPPQTLVAVAAPGISVQVGDTITLHPRHRDANAACSFTPNLILPGHHS